MAHPHTLGHLIDSQLLSGCSDTSIWSWESAFYLFIQRDYLRTVQGSFSCLSLTLQCTGLLEVVQRWSPMLCIWEAWGFRWQSPNSMAMLFSRGLCMNDSMDLLDRIIPKRHSKFCLTLCLACYPAANPASERAINYHSKLIGLLMSTEVQLWKTSLGEIRLYSTRQF